MVNRRNDLIDLSLFNKRLTSWAERKELEHAVKNFLEDDVNSYGNTFIIKRNNVNKKYAIFIHEGNELRRVKDKALKYNIGDLLLLALSRKREGICLLNTFLMAK